MKEKKNIIIIILTLIVIVLGFLYLTDKKSVEYIRPDTVLDTVAASPNESPKIKVTEVIAAKSCSDNLAEELKKDNIKYEKGSLIVSFQASVSLDEAKAIFRKANIEVIEESFVDQNFSSTHRMTGKVADGEELLKVCLLREDSHIKYAGVNELFTLHQ